MPRLTYCPSRSSCATRAASCVRVNAILGHREFSCGDAFDALTLWPDVDDALHEYAGKMHVLRVDRPRLHELLYFSDRDPPRHRAQRVEVTRRLVKDEISRTIAD